MSNRHRHRQDGALRVLLQFLRVRESGDPYAFRFEPQDYILPTAGGDSPSARFEWTPEVLAELQAVHLPGRDPNMVQRLGERLRRFVKDAGWMQHESDIAEALSEHRSVYLTVRSSAAELYALPWELLTLKSGQFLGEVEGLLLRFEWPGSNSIAEKVPPAAEGGRILVAWSAAGGAVPAAQHVRAIAAACTAGFHPFDSRNDVLAHASLGRIAKMLAEAQQSGPPITILHLLCHGAAASSTFGLCLDGEEGPVVADAAELRQQLAPFASMVRLVVLSACNSGNAGAMGSHLGSVAQALHRCGFCAVIASRFPLSVAGSITLTESFYGELLSRPASLEAAFCAARQRLLSSESSLPRELRSLDWASLQLYFRHDDGDDTRPVVFRPFRGLLAFQPEHRRFFFGRDKEVQEILSDLQALIDHKRARFLVVAGASGTGKSSVVLAGAVPKLLGHSPELVFLRMRPGSDAAQALDEALATYPAGKPALLVVDQFEELFTQHASHAARESFGRRLWSLASAPEPGLRIIITLRVDFIGHCGELVVDASGLRLDRVAYDEAHRIFIAQLEPQQLCAAIIEPVRKVGLTLQEGLVDRMLQEVGDEPGALPLLEDALDVLWQQREGRTLTQATYDALGGVVGALQRRADAIISKLSREDLSIAQRLFVNLVAVADDTACDTRLRVELSDLQNIFSGAQAAGFDRVLRELVAARLLVQDGDGHLSRVEVAHEALIRKWPTLRTWLDEDRAGLLMQRRVRQVAQHWEIQHHDESLLYRGLQLAHASEWRKAWELRLGPLERSFLDASEELRVRQERESAERQRREREAEEQLAEERRQKEKQKLEAAQTLALRTRVAALVLGVLLLAAVIAGWVAHQNSIKAKMSAEAAHDELLLAVAQTRKDSPETVVMLLREAKHLSSTLAIQSAWDAIQAGVADIVLRGHESEVLAVAFSPDGQKIASGSHDHTVRISNSDGTGNPIVLKRHKGSVYSVAFSPDGSKLATAAADGAVLLWNSNGAGSPILLDERSTSTRSLAFNPDGKKLITVSADGLTYVMDVDGSSPARAVAKLPGYISTAAISRTGDKIFTCTGYPAICSVTPEGEGPPVVLTGEIKARVSAVAFSPSGARIVISTNDRTARIFNTDGSGKPVVLTGETGVVLSASFSPDGEEVITGSTDNTARIWNSHGREMPVVLKGHDGNVLSVAFSPDGKRVVTGSADNAVRIFTIYEKRIPTTLRGHTDTVAAVAFSPDGRSIATASEDHTARIFYADGSGTPIVLSGHADGVTSVAFSPDGKRVLTGSWDKTARIFLADGSGTPIVLSGHADGVTSVAFSPDGKRVLTGSWDKTARISLADGSGVPIVLSGHENGVYSVAFSPDGKQVVTASNDRGTNQTTRIFNAAGAGAPALFSFNDESRGVPSYEGGGRIMIRRGRLEIQSHGRGLYSSSVAFSPDGRNLVVSARDNDVHILNTNGTGAPLLLKGPNSGITSVAFSPDGTKVVAGSIDSTVRIWNVDGSGNPLVLRNDGCSTSVAFSPDGTKIAAGSWEGTTRVWVVASEPLRSLLWDATNDCMIEARRRELLVESPAAAAQGYERCRKEIARRRGWPLP